MKRKDLVLKDLVLTTTNGKVPANPLICPWCNRVYNHTAQYSYPGPLKLEEWNRLFGRTLANEVCNRCLDEREG